VIYDISQGNLAMRFRCGGSCNS